MAIEIPYHTHNGVDAPQIEFDFLETRKHYERHTIIDADAATAANYGVFFTAPWPCVVTGVWESHNTAGTDAGAVGLNIEKLTGTQALDGGTTILTSNINLKAAAHTQQEPALVVNINSRQLNKGDRLAMKDSGTLTAVNNVTVILEVIY